MEKPLFYLNRDERREIRIFEGSASLDVLRLLVGQLPPSRTGPAKPMPADAELENSLPVSSHYARLLAELAQERGFDGYLLNIECEPSFVSI